MAADFALGWLPDTRALCGADGAVRGVGPVGGQITDTLFTVQYGPFKTTFTTKLLVINWIFQYSNRGVVYVAVSRCCSGSQQFTQTR